MTGRWSEPGVPHAGWACVGVEDLGEADAVCEMCCVREIRYVHHMAHPDWPGSLAVGCHCAAAMAGDPVGTRRRESAMRGRASRRDRWVLRDWKLTRKGSWRVKADGYVCVVTRYDRGWRGSYLRQDTTSWRAGSLYHATSSIAMLALFDHLWPARARVEP